MVFAVSTGVGLAWLVASLVLLLLVTIVIATGDSIEELDPSDARRETLSVAEPEAAPTSTRAEAF